MFILFVCLFTLFYSFHDYFQMPCRSLFISAFPASCAGCVIQVRPPWGFTQVSPDSHYDGRDKCRLVGVLETHGMNVMIGGMSTAQPREGTRREK
ncbi:hypothetical protein F5Y01DRAFT_230949 [Xylaria sp. FL0043]|nr:hypothetical protein F5Y01DRAFT_230949 [Xylaria sp. FL0043]